MMTRLSLMLSATAAILLAYPTLASAEEKRQQPPELQRHELKRPIRTYKFIPEPDTLAQEVNISRILFLNRCVGGCVIQPAAPGQDDARTNRSSIVEQTSELSEFAYSDEVWNQVVECVRDVYAPFDIDVVTEDPGEDVFHHEAIVAGSPGEAGLGENIGGIAPISCSPLNNVMSFSFANGSFSNGDPLDICWTVAQESAHAYGLDHVFNCYDPMTYLPTDPDTGLSCGQKFFRDEEVPCGEFGPRDCLEMCPGSAPVQNSHQQLMNVFGPNPTAIDGPAVTIQMPSADTAVEDGFAIRFNAIDPRGVAYSELYINGWQYGPRVPGHPIQNADALYYIEAPEFPDGILNLEVRSYNDLGVTGSATVQVQKGEPCQSADQCFAGMICDAGACTYPPPTQELGDTCEDDRDCISLLCARAGDESHCTQECIPGVTTSCPESFDCVAAGSDHICWPGADSGGDDGGCSAGGAGGLSAMWLGLGVVALALRSRKRGARRA